MVPILRWWALWLAIVSISFPVRAEILQPKAPVQGKFVAQPYTATVGKFATWTLWVAPVGEGPLPRVEILPADPYRWQFLQPVVFALDDEQMVEIRAVPLAVGEVAPTVAIRAGVDTAPLILTAPKPVSILDVESQVEIVLLPESVESYVLQVRNRSPFALSELQFVPTGSGVTLVEKPAIQVVDASSTSASVPVKALLSGALESPRLVAHYRWVDDLGVEQVGASVVDWTVAAKPDDSSGGWLSGLPPELSGALIGFLFGILASVMIEVARRLIEIPFQRNRDRERTRALMEVAAHKAVHAAEQGITFDMSSIETILNDAGLFARMQDMRAYDAVRSLWECGDRHNAGITLPGGNRRAEKLKDAAVVLRRFLPKKTQADKESISAVDG